MEYIAHISDDTMRQQTVKSHCLETALISKEYGKYLDISNIAYLQGVIHDFGKLCTKFTEYIKKENNIKRGGIDHSYAGARYIFELAQKIDDTDIVEVSKLIAKTVISHHGIHDWVNQDGIDYFTKRISNDENYEEILSQIGSIISNTELIKLLGDASKEYSRIRDKIFKIPFKSLEKNIKKFNQEKKETTYFYMGLFERLMQSILVDADRTNTADFMSNSKLSLNYDFKSLWNDMSIRLEERYKSFSVKNDKISLQRMSIANRCLEFSNHKVGICRLIVPTGGGKTLSSLRFAVNYSKNFDMKKIIYVAPFMSILEQNSDVISSIVGDEKLFLEHHSNVVQTIDDMNKQELNHYELHTQKWDSPVIATTLVQFLNTLFSSKLSCVRRMHELSKAVIIIDEIQSMPLKCVYMFNLAMNFLSQICDCTIILCSATQPLFEDTKYPILIDKDNSMTGDYTQDFEVFKKVNIVSKITPYGYSYEEATSFCYDRYLENGNLLIVLNTKSSARNMYRLLNQRNELASDNEKAKIVHLSTNMCPEHRRKILKDVKECLKPENPKRIICVTTQLIEAGVDISFKCVVRSLAGLDNAVQSAGRCNRNGEYDNCNLYMIKISDENITRLSSIKDAQEVSNQMISMEMFEDLLSVDAMSCYFNFYYELQKKLLSYPVRDCDNDTNLINLLSINRNRVCQKIRKIGNYQAFATAGKLFKVIDEDTISVIVPYNDDAKRLILELNSDLKPNQIVEKLKEVQKYTINIYSNMKNVLMKDNKIYYLKSNVLALSRCYSEEVGLDENLEDFSTYVY